eukprot:g26819.t1
MPLTIALVHLRSQTVPDVPRAIFLRAPSNMPLGPLPDIRATSLPEHISQEEWEKSFKGSLKGDRPAFPDCSGAPGARVRETVKVSCAEEKAEKPEEFVRAPEFRSKIPALRAERFSWLRAERFSQRSVVAMATRRKGGPTKLSSSSKKELSVIVPTYNETENVRPLTKRLFEACKAAGLTIELVVTEKIVKALASEGYAVRIHCRKAEEGRGLSSAVLLGFEKAKYATLLCMDADLQHEPESVPDVAQPVLEGTAEFAIGSRHVEGGGLGFEWSMMRRVVSGGATLLACFLVKSTDPMSGFFCVSKEVLKRGEEDLNPIGFKIALEIMVRCRCNPIKDERNAGESKLSASQYKLYLLQLLSLYMVKYKVLVLVMVLMVWFLIFLVLSRFMTKPPKRSG